MKPYILRDINRALIKVNPKARPDIIKEYSDFLKLKDTITYYDFNAQVLETLINIAYDRCINKKRYDKRRLFSVIKLYYKKRPSNYVLPQDKADQLFEIYKIAAHTKNKDILFPVNHLLLGREFNDLQVQWLIDNWFRSETVLNRLLHHPVKNTKISEWAASHFEEKQLRGRRVELLGWLLDIKPDFKLNSKTVIDDFNYLIDLDKKEYASFLFEQGQEKILTDKKWKAINSEFGIDTPEEGMNSNYAYSLEMPYLHNFKRKVFYSRLYDTTFNVQSTRTDFMKKLDYNTIRMQCWGIAYSHLDIRVKEMMLQKLYRQDLIWTFINISVKLKSSKLLQWIKKNG